jgi:hypothetical protein
VGAGVAREQGESKRREKTKDNGRASKASKTDKHKVQKKKSVL